MSWPAGPEVGTTVQAPTLSITPMAPARRMSGARFTHPRMPRFVLSTFFLLRTIEARPIRQVEGGCLGFLACVAIPPHKLVNPSWRDAGRLRTETKDMPANSVGCL